MSWSKVRGVLAILTLLFAVIAAPPSDTNADDSGNAGGQPADSSQSCQQGVNTICASTASGIENTEGCDAIMKKGNDNKALFEKTEKLLNVHLTTSLEYLLIGLKFNQWDSYRQNFRNHFDKLSDDAWNDAVDLIHHLTKRGHSPKISVDSPKGVSDLDELSAFAAAFDKEQNVVANILDVVSEAHSNAHDPEMTHYFSEHLTDVRTIKLKHSANHVHTLSLAVLNNGGQEGVRDPNLVYSLYDQYVLGK